MWGPLSGHLKRWESYESDRCLLAAASWCYAAVEVNKCKNTIRVVLGQLPILQERKSKQHHQRAAYSSLIKMCSADVEVVAHVVVSAKGDFVFLFYSASESNIVHTEPTHRTINQRLLDTSRLLVLVCRCMLGVCSTSVTNSALIILNADKR